LTKDKGRVPTLWEGARKAAAAERGKKGVAAVTSEL
jgi:hypothetical protein